MLLFDITASFNATVRGMVKNPDLLKACTDSPRRHMVLQNLCREITSFERKFGNRATKQKRDLIITTVADMFVKSVWVEYAKMGGKFKPAVDPLAEAKKKGEDAKELLCDMGVMQKETVKSI